MKAAWPDLDELRARVDDAVRANVPAGPVALLDAPSFWSVGDNAIWTIQQRMAARFGWDVRYAATTKTFDVDRLARTLPPGGTIVFSAGGSLGDVWPKPQLVREEVCKRFLDHRIVILTQGMYFADDDNLDRATDAFSEHPDLTIMVRDHRSEVNAIAAFPKADVQITPDLVLWLGALARPTAPTRDIVLVARRDIESRWPEGFPVEARGAALDWEDAGGFDDGWRRADARYRWFVRMRCRAPRVAGAVADREMRAITGLARARFRAGLAMLSSGRVVVTDRLHAHLLCLLMDIPHVVLDNNFGKLGALMDTWTGAAPAVHRAETPAEAFEMATKILAAARDRV